MRKVLSAWTLLALAAVVLCSCASVTPETTAEEGAWLTLQTIDTAQTANIARTPNAQEAEAAWIIGREPRRGDDVYAYMGAMAALHVSAAIFMDAHDWPRWLRRTFEALTLADASNCVIGNYRLRIAAHF